MAEDENSSQYSVTAGNDAAWQVQIQSTDQDGNQTPYTAFTTGDTLSAEVWAGQDQGILVVPSVSWVSTPNTGLFKLTMAGSQTSTLGAGRYRLRVLVTATDGTVRPVLDTVLTVLASPGASLAPAVYCVYDDLLQYAPWLDSQEDLDTDLSGYAKQRAQARAHFDRVILSRVPSAQGYLGIGFGGAMYPNEGTNPYVFGLLNTNKLVVTPQVVEINARYAIGLIADSMISPKDQKSGYQAIADRMFARSNALLLGYIAEFDILGTGTPPYFSIPCNTLSTRVPTPSCTAWGWY